MCLCGLGPIEETEYWKQCQSEFKSLPNNVNCNRKHAPFQIDSKRYETKTKRGTTKGRFPLNTCHERQNCVRNKFSQAALSFIIS